MIDAVASGHSNHAHRHNGHDDDNDHDDNMPCYCGGTSILTPDGEVPVEALRIGDEVVTYSGEARPIRWIGSRAYGGRFITGKASILPIRVAAGALSDGVPARDLWISPGHALYIDGVLVPAEHLLNGTTITQAESVETVEYFHIELDEHDVVFADGAPAETFTDCDNRGMFKNGAEYARLYPADQRPSWDFCATRLEADAPELTAIRTALLERAEALGHELDFDPDLHLIVDGEVVRPSSAAASLYRFEIPAGAGVAWLASRSTSPAEVQVGSLDRRRLGVPIERLLLYGADLSIEMWHGHAALGEGFHYDEKSHRWTDGLGLLPDILLRPFTEGRTLEVHLLPAELRYHVPASSEQVAAA
jgi:hypothetical protein